MKLSLETLLHRLVGRGAQLAASTPIDPDEKTTPTSIRLRPATKHFLQAQATALNTSVQGVIDTILDGVMEATMNTPASQLRSIRERFFLLIQAHRLDLPAAVELLASEGFTLSALGNDDRLMDLMTPKAIKHVSEIFFVSEAWLSGKSDSAIVQGSDVHWYKNVHRIARRLIDLRQQGLRPDLMFIRRHGADFERAYEDNDRGNWRTEPVGIVMRVVKTTPSGADFTTYQVWEFQRWNYGPCRQELKRLIAFCEQMRIHVVGHDLPQDDLNSLLSGRKLPATLFPALGCSTWHPDDYASFGFEVRYERNEWLSMAEDYRKSSLPKLAVEAGAAELPDQPWRPKAPVAAVAATAA